MAVRFVLFEKRSPFCKSDSLGQKQTVYEFIFDNISYYLIKFSIYQAVFMFPTPFPIPMPPPCPADSPRPHGDSRGQLRLGRPPRPRGRAQAPQQRYIHTYAYIPILVFVSRIDHSSRPPYILALVCAPALCRLLAKTLLTLQVPHIGLL